MDNKLILTLGGDFYSNTFNMYSADLSFKNLNFSIFLTAEQTQMAIDYDDIFEPVMGLKNILSDSGINYIQKIVIDQCDNSDSTNFLKQYSGIEEKAWNSIGKLTLKDTFPQDSMGGNIVIKSEGGHIFEISTENYDISTSELIKEFSELLSCCGISVNSN